jgi:acetolactate synthase-1/2/3 large subunit
LDFGNQLMKVADYIVNFLVRRGVTDVFGLPGGVVLDFLQALDRKKSEITPRLNYHEQASAFAACGYAQTSATFGVAYATKGPGFTNMVTGIADAYHNSIPVLFITAHGSPTSANLRFEETQKLDSVHLVSKITKYAAYVTNVQNLDLHLERACAQMLSGRRGPALLDFSPSLFQLEVEDRSSNSSKIEQMDMDSVPVPDIIAAIQSRLEKSLRPIILIGDGINQTGTRHFLEKIVTNLQIPVLSSRFAQDVIPNSRYYFGHIGSHGTRHSNFILSKCDFVLALGNRCSFNPKSKSFLSFANKAKKIRVDCDKGELTRSLPETQGFLANLSVAMPTLAEVTWPNSVRPEWLNVCDELKRILSHHDIEYPVMTIANFMKKIDDDVVLVSDVGNNEMWLSHAYLLSGKTNRILYSNNFGSLGCSLPKAMGVYYATRKRVICFAGDLGIQMNFQELQQLVVDCLPITIVIINTHSSAMIKDAQRKKGYINYPHTTQENGYSIVDFRKLAGALSLPYFFFESNSNIDRSVFPVDKPCIVEFSVDAELNLLPFLPQENACQDFYPLLPRDLYEYLDQI